MGAEEEGEGGGRRRKEKEEEGSPGTSRWGYSRSVPSPSPSFSFKISAVLCSPQKGTTAISSLRSGRRRPKRKRRSRQKTHQHPWPAHSSQTDPLGWQQGRGEVGWGGGLLAPALPNEQRLEVGVRGGWMAFLWFT